MVCYECSLAGNRRDAVGVCHFCSAGLCAEHANVVAEVIGAQVPIVKMVALPRKARRLFCSICKEAVEQLREAVPVQQEVGSPEEKHELQVH